MVNLNESEEKILGYWKKNRINEKVREKNKGGKKFYFLDGPPFVTGDLHPGQMWVKSNKDIVLRYKRMRGFNVYDRSGYDVHGLPIENKVEAKLGIKSKKGIEAIGLEEFTRQCKEFVMSYIGRMDRDYERFGMSLDFSNPYNPADSTYIEGAWGMFKSIYEKGYVYEGKRTLMYCPHCETVVAQGSLEVEYQEDTDPSLFVLFKVDNKRSKPKGSGIADDNTYLLIWTTTPWTIPANMAVMASPKELYIKAQLSGRNVILAKATMQRVVEALGESAVVISEFYGSELEGIYYTSPLAAEIPKQMEFNKFHRIVFSEEMVTVSEGTGLVHIAPGHGLEDYTIGTANGLPVFSPVNLQAKYTGDAGAFAGLRVPDEANTKVLEALEANGALAGSGKITHSYPHCWRCHSKTVQIATDQWFINIQKAKKRLLRENGRVLWYPAEARRWHEDVLANSPDWCVSRQRYWGIPIPLWRCAGCGETIAIGSLEELKGCAVDSRAAEGLTDLHRPFIDRITIKCRKCGAPSERIRDVLDVWFDSSVAFRLSLTDSEFERYFPVDYIAEAAEQLRGWFSYMLKAGVLVYGKRPFINVFTHRMMMDEKGRPMHKSLSNFIPLSEIINAASADSFRMHCLAHPPESDFPLSLDNLKEVAKALILIHNLSNMLGEYSGAAGYRPMMEAAPRRAKLDIEDAWIISRLNTLIGEVTGFMDSYQMYKAVAAVRDFITLDFSRFYLKIAKKKILYRKKADARRTVGVVNYLLFNTVLLIAPMVPFTAEAIFLEHYTRRGESVFLEGWPKPRAALVDKGLEGAMCVAQDVITAILNSREKNGISLRWPISTATVEATDDPAYSSIERLATLIEEYTNVKHLILKKAIAGRHEVKPVFAIIGPDFKEKAQAVSDALRGADADLLLDSIAKSGKYELETSKGPVEIREGHFITVERAEGGGVVQFRHGRVHIDTNITNELKDEARVREFEHEVQLIRKELKLKKRDRIGLGYLAVGAFAGTIRANAKKIAKDVNAAELADTLEVGSVVRDLDIWGETVKVSVKKREDGKGQT